MKKKNALCCDLIFSKQTHAALSICSSCILGLFNSLRGHQGDTLSRARTHITKEYRSTPLERNRRENEEVKTARALQPSSLEKRPALLLNFNLLCVLDIMCRQQGLYSLLVVCYPYQAKRMSAAIACL